MRPATRKRYSMVNRRCCCATVKTSAAIQIESRSDVSGGRIRSAIRGPLQGAAAKTLRPMLVSVCFPPRGYALNDCVTMPLVLGALVLPHLLWIGEPPRPFGRLDRLWVLSSPLSGCAASSRSIPARPLTVVGVVFFAVLRPVSLVVCGPLLSGSRAVRRVVGRRATLAAGTQTIAANLVFRVLGVRLFGTALGTAFHLRIVPMC